MTPSNRQPPAAQNSSSRGNSSASAVWLVARREIRTRSRTKAYRAGVVIMFILILGGIGLSKAASSDTTTSSIVVGLNGKGIEYVDDFSSVGPDVSTKVVAGNKQRQLLLDGDVDVVFDGESLLWNQSADPSVEVIVSSVVFNRDVAQRAADAGLSPEDLSDLLSPPQIANEFIDEEDATDGARLTAALVTSVVIFMLIQLWGSYMTMGVVEEKQSRVVEVLLAQVDSRTLLLGKTLGLGLLAAFQMGTMLVAAVIGGLAFYSLSIPGDVWAAAPGLLLFFVLGLAFYLTLFAAAGTLVSRQEDVQAVSLPASMPLIIGYIITAGAVTEPHNPVGVVASLIPFTAPIVMPFRLASGGVPIWQVALSTGLLLVGTWWMIKVAGRVYRMLLLRTGTRVKWSEAFAVATGRES